MNTSGAGATPRAEQERSLRRRTEILNAAILLLTRSGMNGVTHRSVAAEAGASLGSIRYYFESREALLLACIDRIDTLRAETARTAISYAAAHRLDSIEAARLALLVYDGPELDDGSLRGMIGWVADCARESLGLSDRLGVLRRGLDADLRDLLDAAGYAAVSTRLAAAVIDGAVFTATAEARVGIADLVIADLVELFELTQPVRAAPDPQRTAAE